MTKDRNISLTISLAYFFDEEEKGKGLICLQIIIPVLKLLLLGRFELFPTKVEQAFETLKSGLLEIRPINERIESSVRGHVFVCMLALKVTHYLEKMLKELNFPIKYVLDTLNEIQYREIVYTDIYRIKTLPDILSDDQTRILQMLKITLPKQL